MMDGKAIWTPSCKGYCADAHWVMTHGHKTQSFIKTEVSKSPGSEPIWRVGLKIFSLFNVTNERVIINYLS